MMMKLAGFVLRHPWLYRLSGWMGRRIGPLLPRFLLYSRWNTWGRGRELPDFPPTSFRDLYRRRDGR